MIRINQLKLPVFHEPQALKKKAAKTLRLREDQITSLAIVKQSIDARKKEDLKYIYSVDVEIQGKEDAVIKKAGSPNVLLKKEALYHFPERGTEPLPHRPVIIGCGPAGLFCGLMLARAGYHPLLLERGETVEERKKTVDAFWAGGPLREDSNVQFGEGGAGTFSDGKLNTLVKDPSGRNQEVLKILVEAGADPSILYVGKPHIGTDVLSLVVKNIREEIRRLGGEVRFGSKVVDLILEHGQIRGLEIEEKQRDGAPDEAVRRGELVPQDALVRQDDLVPQGTLVRRYTLPAEIVVLAVGHSARDTFEMLYKRQVEMQAKSFAVGLRIQHPQKMINLSQYGMEDPKSLGAASYKVTAQTGNGRGVYSFCMCPGGYVVNASSEPGRLAVNGMSNHNRAGVNANSALIVTVTPEDFGEAGPLGGMLFQRNLEEAAYTCGSGKIPVQLYGDFKENRMSTGFGGVEPAFMGDYAFGDLRGLLPPALGVSLIEGMGSFGRKIAGFDRPDAILAGIESRTSSPLRIPRDENCESRVAGLYPCGEGAGYAGGITSAAMDGIRVAEALAARFTPAE